MTAKNKTIKLISAFLIISMIAPTVLLSVPKKANAFGFIVYDPTNTAVATKNSIGNWISKAFNAITSKATTISALKDTKEWAAWLLTTTLRTVAKAVLARMTQATINWINSDFHGSPLFIENPESFFRDIAKSELRRLVDAIGYDTFRFPFGKQTALNVISSYKRQLADNAAYTLSNVINDPDLLRQYRNDFNYGGWNGFLINTQYPQNNYLGFNMIIEQNLASRLQGTLVAPAQKIQNLLQQGMGFLSPQTCPSNPRYNNGVNEFLQPSFNDSKYDKEHPFDPSTGASGSLQWSNAKDQAKARWTFDNTCPGGLVNTTPGSVAANQIMTAMSSNFRQSELATAFGNSLSAIFDALINHFFDKGLNALAETISPAPSEDNWSYDGSTLGGATTYTAPGISALRIPQNVTATVGQVTSTMISGGTAPYRIQDFERNRINPSVATAQISASGPSGPTLTVTGIAPGQTLVVVEDSSNPVQTVTVQIAINAIGALTVIPHDILTDLSHPISAIISGGEGPYFLRIGPNEAVAIADFAGANLIVSGIERGNTFMVIEDSSFPIKKTTTVQITINGPGDLIIPQNVLVNVGQVTSVPITGGTEPYLVTDQQDIRIATGQIFNAVQNTPAALKITGITAGETAIVIKDSSSPIKIANINITVIDNRTLIVTPQNISASVGQTTIATASGGAAPYSLKTSPNETVATSQIWGSNILIAGVAPGQTSVIVKDSSTPAQTVTVPIIIGSLMIAPQNASFGISQATSLTISGGMAPYSIETPPGAEVATAQIFNNGQSASATLTIVGVASGQTSVIVKDSSTPAKTAGIQVVIN